MLIGNADPGPKTPKTHVRHRETWETGRQGRYVVRRESNPGTKDVRFVLLEIDETVGSREELTGAPARK